MFDAPNAFKRTFGGDTVKNLLTQWAQAGDPGAMIRLAEIYSAEGDLDSAKKFFAQAAEKNYRPAARKLAELFDAEENFPQAIKFYRKAAELNDVAAMERLVDLCPNDAEILDAVLEIIDAQYNEIYFMCNVLEQVRSFGSHRLSEFFPGQAAAIERRRIRNKILKLKSAV